MTLSRFFSRSSGCLLMLLSVFSHASNLEYEKPNNDFVQCNIQEAREAFLGLYQDGNYLRAYQTLDTLYQGCLGSATGNLNHAALDKEMLNQVDWFLSDYALAAQRARKFAQCRRLEERHSADEFSNERARAAFEFNLRACAIANYQHVHELSMSQEACPIEEAGPNALAVPEGWFAPYRGADYHCIEPVYSDDANEQIVGLVGLRVYGRQQVLRRLLPFDPADVAGCEGAELHVTSYPGELAVVLGEHCTEGDTPTLVLPAFVGHGAPIKAERRLKERLLAKLSPAADEPSPMDQAMAEGVAHYSASVITDQPWHDYQLRSSARLHSHLSYQSEFHKAAAKDNNDLLLAYMERTEGNEIELWFEHILSGARRKLVTLPASDEETREKWQPPWAGVNAFSLENHWFLHVRLNAEDSYYRIALKFNAPLEQIPWWEFYNGQEQFWHRSRGDKRLGGNCGSGLCYFDEYNQPHALVTSLGQWDIHGQTWDPELPIIYFDNRSDLACIWKYDLQNHQVSKVVPNHFAEWPIPLRIDGYPFVVYQQYNYENTAHGELPMIKIAAPVEDEDENQNEDQAKKKDIEPSAAFSEGVDEEYPYTEGDTFEGRLTAVSEEHYHQLLAQRVSFPEPPQVLINEDYEQVRGLLGKQARNEPCPNWDTQTCLQLYSEQGERIGEPLELFECEFVGYYPDERLLHFNCGHESQALLSLEDGERIREEPLNRRYALDGRLRLTSYYNGQEPHLFFQASIDGQWRAVESFPLEDDDGNEIWLIDSDFTWLGEREFVMRSMDYRTDAHRYYLGSI